MQVLLSGAYDDRAFRACFRAARREGVSYDQPRSGADTLVDQQSGRMYLVLSSVRGPLAVYRITNDDRLRALRAWPKWIVDLYG
ncbi:MAG: hypothetical protein U1F56_17220 [Rubrivivax sp.]